MTSISFFGRRFICAAAGIAIAVAPAVAFFGGFSDSAARLTAECQEVQQQDSFSENCSPATEANDTDQLTEQEVAEPGFNASPEGHGSGGTGGSSGGGHH